MMLELGDALGEDDCGTTQPASRTQSNPASAFIVSFDGARSENDAQEPQRAIPATVRV